MLTADQWRGRALAAEAENRRLRRQNHYLMIARDVRDALERGDAPWVQCELLAEKVADLTMQLQDAGFDPEVAITTETILAHPSLGDPRRD